MSKKPKTISDVRDDHRTSLEALSDAHSAMGKEINRLWQVFEIEYGEAPNSAYLDGVGKFTEAGVKRLHGFFVDGKSSNREIARFFGVTDGAISNRRELYLKIAPRAKANR